MDFSRDYYAILGVLHSAEDVVIRAAYRALALRYHPDQWRGDPSTSERLMRDLNAAYEVLSDPQKRREYDRRRKKSDFDTYEADNENAKAAFTSAEEDQHDAWELATEYFPDLNQITNRLRVTSVRLAFAFRATLLETKEFEGRHEMAHALEVGFLRTYFGKNEATLNFARELIASGRRDVAKELNRAVTVLGDNVSAEIISRLRAKFDLINPEVKAKRRHLAERVTKTRYTDDAIALVEALGGKITTRDLSWLPFGEITLLVECGSLSHTTQGWEKMVDWIITHIAPLAKR